MKYFAQMTSLSLILLILTGCLPEGTEVGNGNETPSTKGDANDVNSSPNHVIATNNAILRSIFAPCANGLVTHNSATQFALVSQKETLRLEFKNGLYTLRFNAAVLGRGEVSASKQAIIVKNSNDQIQIFEGTACETSYAENNSVLNYKSVIQDSGNELTLTWDNTNGAIDNIRIKDKTANREWYFD